MAVKKLTRLERVVYSNSRKRTNGFRKLGSDLKRTHDYAIPTTTIAAGVFERVSASYRLSPVTFSTAIEITSAGAQKGLIFGYGDLTSSIAMWVENTDTAITSVIDSVSTPGVARFLFTPGPTLAIGQKVIISTFAVETTYNVTGTLTNAGAGFMEISSVAFTSTDTGSFNINSISAQVGDNEGSPNANSTVLSYDTGDFPTGHLIRLGLMVIPGSEKVRLWANGKIVDSSDSTSGAYTGGVWSNDGAGSFADIPKIVYAGVPAASRIAPSGFEAVESLSIYAGQIPRQFNGR